MEPVLPERMQAELEEYRPMEPVFPEKVQAELEARYTSQVLEITLRLAQPDRDMP